MKILVWSPIALIADSVRSFLADDPRFAEVTTFGAKDVGPNPRTSIDADLVIVIGVPLDECRRVFDALDIDGRSRTVAVYLARSPEPFFESRALLFGLAAVVDLSAPTTDVVTSLLDAVESGPTISSASTWTLDQRTPVEVLFSPHCRDERDVDILRHIVNGHTDSHIAEILNLNPQTIRNRVSNMLLESGMTNRTQLAVDFYRSLLAQRGVTSLA